MAKLIYQNQEGIQNTQETYDTVKMSAVSTPFIKPNTGKSFLRQIADTAKDPSMANMQIGFRDGFFSDMYSR